MKQRMCKKIALAVMLGGLLAAPISAQAQTAVFKQDALIEVNFLAREFSVRESDLPAKAYYDEVAAELARNGGEILGVFDVYQVTDGLIRPESIGLVQWPDIAAFKTFKAAIDAAALGARTEVWRSFFTVGSFDRGPTVETLATADTTISFDNDRVYEFLSVIPNPVGFPKAAPVLLGEVLPIAVNEFGQVPLVDLVPADLSGTGVASDLTTMLVTIIEWPDRDTADAWIFDTPLYTDAVRDLLDPATDRREIIWARPVS